MIEGFDLVTKLFHMGERITDDFARPVPQITHASQLANLNVFEQFLKITREIIHSDDEEVALLGRRVLEDILFPQLPQMRQTNPELYLKYQKLIVLLKFMNLPVYGLREIDKIIRENLVTALQMGLLAKEKFQKVLDDYNDFLMEGKIAEELGKAMITCEEKIGKNLILGLDNKIKPQIAGNWLSDYIQEGLSGGEHRTGSIERTVYFQKNQNAQRLGSEEKKILSEIFRLYDWLKYGDEISGEEIQRVGDATGLPYMRAQQTILPTGVVGSLKQSLAYKESGFVPSPPQPQARSQENLLQSQKDVEEQKRLAQQQIDQKLEELKKKYDNAKNAK